MQKNKQIILQQILDQGMLPLFYTDSAQVSVEIIRTLYKAGVRVLEYTNRGQAALENFKLLKKTFVIEAPDLSLGIGTIKTKQEAQDFMSAGADFIVSPIVNPEVATLCHQKDMLWIPGCMTPTEIYTAQQNRAALIKIFPANILGPEFISSIRELFGGQLFMPTGGVELNRENISTWFKAGVCAVGMGSKLISKTVLEKEQYDVLLTNTKEALELVKASR
ncbi:MAG TPA: bifunctional 4-hydroxy-2-oxoglutarate aldolase/2-dehydro-3-deoxy-phosphogluconate aldolase [Cyclobacteriaceae bacterium]